MPVTKSNHVSLFVFGRGNGDASRPGSPLAIALLSYLSTIDL